MTENNDTTDEQQATSSPALIVTGILTLAVSGWAIAGGPLIDLDLDLWPWVLIVVGVLVGVALVISGFRNRADES